ncbi:uncharacterized protein PHALS_11279 [Plasmopara halstedii]|uniref:Uncharacterized protein n=1 Tax=Plasmopara halstedii TaxID=4781 RepID=A0A0P1AKG6_PLAHL|nr:uncharacterized protein PHALS_11279 [Plasmopara halstedii]CEG41114.1 hypothetical protein PHALS_11279 [Plasmopara halstedii]|eukprot:XP_024577483.1 hypothetical protein PHALS_11279 [Plasmopara halstedii]
MVFVERAGPPSVPYENKPLNFHQVELTKDDLRVTSLRVTSPHDLDALWQHDTILGRARYAANI